MDKKKTGDEEVDIVDVFDNIHTLFRRRQKKEKFSIAPNLLGGGGSSSNDANVQAVLDRATALGYTLPDSTRITALNTFFTSISSLLSLAENIKIYALNNASLSQFSTLNYVSPTLYQTTLHGSPTYGVNGFRSAGAGSYLLENITVNRRAGIQDDFSELVSTNSSHTADETLMNIFGASTDASRRLNLLSKAFGAAGGRGFNDSSVGPLTANHDGFYSICSKVGGTVHRVGKNGSYNDGALTSTAPSGLADYNMATCAWNNNASIIRNHTQADAEFRWSGFELSDANVATISTAFQTYLTAIGL